MENRIVYKNTRVTYYCYGEGIKTLVLLHGFLENSAMWESMVDEFSNELKIISIDLLGHGNSECLGYIHTMEEIAESVASVLTKEEENKAIFVGHSMGGYVALALAEKYPEFVEKLCLLNSTAQADSEERKMMRDRAIQMAKTNYNALVSMSISNLFSSETSSEFTAEIADCKKEALKTPVQGYIACAEGMKQRKNREHILQSEAYESLLIIGKKDPVLVYEDSLAEANRTQTPIIELSNGHMSHIENKKELLNSLRDFIHS
ncbi:alpha/beta hydrolase [Tenacibaculum sp. SZ-18]|uniref:alpha/beta fold hydrolase n=1 Tax=Tenacibaculum sp. SZ-18 TaxID=754423 RepID=UPI000C2D113F|nr:alpha/beta hydrolase [Tenacibaculum sp. SZ-18]AUC17132.1 alpha/beta hydrolase [Tenacibaculum sp. SZ-18]